MHIQYLCMQSSTVHIFMHSSCISMEIDINRMVAGAPTIHITQLLLGGLLTESLEGEMRSMPSLPEGCESHTIAVDLMAMH